MLPRASTEVVAAMADIDVVAASGRPSGSSLSPPRLPASLLVGGLVESEKFTLSEPCVTRPALEDVRARGLTPSIAGRSRGRV